MNSWKCHLQDRETWHEVMVACIDPQPPDWRVTCNTVIMFLCNYIFLLLISDLVLQREICNV